MKRILVVDDDQGLRETVTAALRADLYEVEQAQDGEEAVLKVKAGSYDLVLLDVNMPKKNGLEALREIKAFDPTILVIILTAFSNVRDAIEATKEGAYNYLEKPVQSQQLVALIDRALRAHKLVESVALHSPNVSLPSSPDFIGQSDEMKKIFYIISKLSQVETAVLIRGESGTGKELVAQALHYNSPRKDNRFVTINCSAIPETLIESEFFGHEKGAFTGAESRKLGKFQYADGGTLFLDEIGDISAAMQVKLLRALQQKRFTPVGSNREIEVNVRIVAATNRNLEEMIKSGEFREDLFYRLNVIPIHLPPLRERKKDLNHLINHFMEKFRSLHGKQILDISSDAQALLENHTWPGNIRELENVIEHAFVIESSQKIEVESLPAALTRKAGDLIKGQLLQFKPLEKPSTETEAKSSDVLEAPTGFVINAKKLDFQASKEEFERQFLIAALKTFDGRINQTALHANIPKKTLLRKLEKYGIVAKHYSKSGQPDEADNDTVE